MKHFASVHLRSNNTKYTDAANRINLVAGTKSLFNADVGYHEGCYKNFCSSKWNKIDSSENIPVKSQSDSFSNLCDLIKIHVIGRREIYSLLDLKEAYDSLKTSSCPILRTNNIKDKVASAFPEDVVFSSLTCGRTKNKLEYILPVGESLTAEIITASYHGGGISKSALLRASATRLHYLLLSSQYKRNWPPTPQDIIEDENPVNPGHHLI